MQEYLITMGISVTLMSLKSAELKRKFRNSFLKIFRAIKLAFPNDVDFQ